MCWFSSVYYFQNFLNGYRQHLFSCPRVYDFSFVFSDVGMVAIIVVCVGFLMFMIILGVIRIRATHRKTQIVQVEDKMEMEWDNSELNITVNPMEKEVYLCIK